MKLYIAEKPSLGRAIADVLPKPHRRDEGCVYVGNGDCVSWCIGHLLEQAEPDVYNPDYKQWCLEHLPIIPDQWQLQPKSSTRKQLAVLRKLVKQADDIVHAGDPDREGQLLVDQLIEHLKVPTAKRQSIQRCLINDLNPQAVARALQQLRSNKEFVALSTSALARARADWLYGINMTRAYTLQGRKVGYQGVLSVGRVQTPVLGLVVKRDEEIENFVAKPFYELIAHLRTEHMHIGQGETFKAKWQPSEACEPWQDEEGRVLSKALVENVASRIKGQPAVVTNSNYKVKQLPPPLPYNLSTLQIDAARRYKLSAQQVLDACQNLYERHKLLTYPRSDCRYLPEQHFAERDQVLAAMANNLPDFGEKLQGADASLQSKAWDDSKVDAHHAIIPTARRADLSKLNATERDIYELVARQYLMQFYRPEEYRESLIELDIGGGKFIARARQTLNDGWQVFFKNPNTNSAAHTDTRKALNSSLPTLEKGDQCHCEQGEILEKQTTPPRAFDDASLLSAMTGIARFVRDPEIRQVLKETDGLGTEATRAGIIELLFKRGFLERISRKIHATDAGRGLIHSLPEVAVTPDMTAQWEMQLNAVAQRQTRYQQFMQPLQERLQDLIIDSQQRLPQALKNVKASKPSYKQSANKKSGRRTNRKPATKANQRKPEVEET